MVTEAPERALAAPPIQQAGQQASLPLTVHPCCAALEFTIELLCNATIELIFAAVLFLLWNWHTTRRLLL